MSNKLFVSEERKLDLFRNELIVRHSQEVRSYSVVQALSSQHQHKQHLLEMARISMLFNPVGWAIAMVRYTRQLTEIASVNRATRNSIKERQEQDVVTLDRLINRQKLFLKDTQRSDILFIDRFNELFDWSLSEKERHFYYQTLHSGYALVLTDMTHSILWVSQAFETMTGYKAVEVTGKNARFLQGETSDQVSIQYLRKHLNQALDVEVDLINYRKKGDAYLCHLDIKLLRNRGGEPTHLMAIEHEIDPQP